jgi:hypothetical protein
MSDLNLIKLTPTFFDLQKSQALMTQWKTTLENYALDAKKKILIYTIIYYSLNIPLFIFTTLSTAIPLFNKESKLPAAFSATSVILLALLTHVAPNKTSSLYYNYFTSCEKIKTQIIFYQSLNLDNNQLQLFMTKIENDIEKLVSHIPSDISNVTFDETTSNV